MIKTKLRIRTYGDPCLRRKSEPVKKIGPAERMLINVMINTIADNENEIGLAAPQIGINKKIFIVDLPEFPRVFVDPKILKKEGQSSMEEGCLSFPGFAFTIKRPKKITVEYLDENKKKRIIECEDFFARVILHETDHLDGVLFVDRASEEERAQNQKALDNLAKKTKKDLKINS
ncbi:MAG: peptide deformylase [Candidatus Omnitrophica bacterium]|nr:peptide deformylase [Candidatus Omnitrophota bacterium]